MNNITRLLALPDINANQMFAVMSFFKRYPAHNTVTHISN